MSDLVYLAYLAALYNSGLLSLSDYRASLVKLYGTTQDTQVMVAVRLRYVRLGTVS